MRETAALEGSNLSTGVLTAGVTTQGEVTSPEQQKMAEYDKKYLQLAQAAFTDSTSWLDANLRKQLEHNYALFRSKHPPGSKYFTEAYRYRAKGFRPKLRTAIRKNEAACKTAFFSTHEPASVHATNEFDEKQVVSAAIHMELLKYRLEHSIPWFMNLIGGFQEAQVNGRVVAGFDWDYRETSTKRYEKAMENGEPVVGDDGQPMYDEHTDVEVISDKPVMRLIPLENFRFDPACDWTDVVGTSPYLIELMPMYLGDVLDMMESSDPKTGKPKWRNISPEQLMSASKLNFDSTRMARENPKQDPYADRNVSENAFTTIWIHKNIIRMHGIDYLYYTVGTEFMLTDPIPLNKVYKHKKRPYVSGIVIPEAFKTTPAGLVELGQDLQVSANDLANSRRDNVNLAMNKRYHIKRTANIDLNAFMRNAPGGGVLMDDPINDVKVIDTPDVTSSSYQEQDRLNVDIDEALGQFSQSSVQTNRNLNETVGGMELMSAGSNQMTEYLITVYANTFVKPCLEQIVALEQAYETDEVIIALAGERAQVFQRYGVDTITDEHLTQNLTVVINVGLDATDPVKRVQKLTFAINAIAAAIQVPGINPAEVIKEILGSIGYTNAKRFFAAVDDNKDDPRIKQLSDKVQELQNIIATDQHKIQAKGQADLQLAQENNAAQYKIKQLDDTSALQKLIRDIDGKLALADKQHQDGLERDDNKTDNRLRELRAVAVQELEKITKTHFNQIDAIEAQGDVNLDLENRKHEHEMEKNEEDHEHEEEMADKKEDNEPDKPESSGGDD